MDGWMDGRMDGRKDGRADGWMAERVNSKPRPSDHVRPKIEWLPITVRSRRHKSVMRGSGAYIFSRYT